MTLSIILLWKHKSRRLAGNNDYVWLWFARPSYKTDKEVQQRRTCHPICIDSFWRLQPVPALSSRKPRILKTYWVSSWVWKCLFPRRGHCVHDSFVTSRDSDKQCRTQLCLAIGCLLFWVYIERNRFSGVDKDKILVCTFWIKFLTQTLCCYLLASFVTAVDYSSSYEPTGLYFCNFCPFSCGYL